MSRIVPTYLAVVALFAALFAALGLSLGGISVLALSLAPAGPRSYPLSVEWTLVLEMSFYVGLAGLAAAGLARRLVPFALGWLVLLAAAFVLLPPDSRNVMPPPAYLLPLSAACMPFAGGLLLPRLIAAGWIRPSPPPSWRCRGPPPAPRRCGCRTLARRHRGRAPRRRRRGRAPRYAGRARRGA